MGKIEEVFTGFYNINDPAKAATLVDEFLLDGFTDFSPAFGSTPDKAGFRQTVAYINQAFRQQYTVEKLIQEGNQYVAVWQSEVTHVGEFMGMPPSQKQFQIRGITIYEIVDGRIQSHWEQFDVLTILQNLGIVQLP